MFLADPLDVPPEVVDYLAGQLGIADASSVKSYAERQPSQWEHAAEIRQAVWLPGLHRRRAAAGGPGVHRRAGLDADGGSAGAVRPVGGVGYGRRRSLPEASLLARLVSEIRPAESDRLHEVMAFAATEADAGAAGWTCPTGAGWRRWPATGWRPSCWRGRSGSRTSSGSATYPAFARASVTLAKAARGTPAGEDSSVNLMNGFTKPRGTDVGGQRTHPHSHPGSAQLTSKSNELIIGIVIIVITG
jgi:hypothetical protein